MVFSAAARKKCDEHWVNNILVDGLGDNSLHDGLSNSLDDVNDVSGEVIFTTSYDSPP